MAALAAGALLVLAPAAAGDGPVAGSAGAAGAADGPAGSVAQVLRAARCMHLAGVDPARTGCDAAATPPVATPAGMTAGPADCVVPVADDRCETWRWDGAGATGRALVDLVAVPGGNRAHALVVASTGLRLVTLAPDGRVLGDTALALPANAAAQHAVLSPDGRTLYIAYRTSGQQFRVAAVATDDGATRWATSEPSADSVVLEVAASGDGRTVVAAGYRVVDDRRVQLGLVALDAATGARRWAAAWGAPAEEVYPYGLAVDADASTTVVVGEAYDVQNGRSDPVALAFGAAGDLRWEHRLAPTAAGYGWFGDVALADGDTAYVTGTHPTGLGAWAGVVRALDLTDGRARWSMSPQPLPYGYTEVAAPVLSPDGKRVHVGGTATAVAGTPYLPVPVGTTRQDQDALALALDTASGRVLWSTRTGTPAHLAEGGYLTALSPDGSRLYQAGFSAGYAYTTTGASVWTQVGDATTTAYDALTGQRLWTARAGEGDPSGFGSARGVVVLEGGSRVVTGAAVGVARSVPAASTFRLRPALLGYER